MQTNCVECGHTVSTWTTKCPGCGRRLRYHPLVKFLAFLVLLGAFVGWEVSTVTDSAGQTETLSRRVVIPFVGAISADENSVDKAQSDSYEQIAVKRTYGYGIYQQDETVTR